MDLTISEVGTSSFLGEMNVMARKRVSLKNFLNIQYISYSGVYVNLKWIVCFAYIPRRENQYCTFESFFQGLFKQHAGMSIFVLVKSVAVATDFLYCE